jgi:ABC-2 type transport system permease protein
VREDPDALLAACEDTVIPSAEDFLYTQSIDLQNEREFGSGLTVVTLLGALMFVAGTTFVGHDWSTGSMSNQLLFEPRRARVWAAKALALVLAAATVSVVVLTAYWLGLYAVVRGRDQAVPDGTLLACLQHGWRGAGIAAAAALGGYALTMLSRSTVFSLGLLFGVSVAGGLLLATIGPRDPGPVDPTINAQAVIADGTTYYGEPPDKCYRDNSLFDTDPDCSAQGARSLGEGLAYYGVLLGVVGVASVGSFRRRDVP